MVRHQRPRRRDNKERQIIDAATDLFRDRGFHGTSMADLAGAVEVRNASLYHYVDSKQELLLRVLEDGLSGFLERLEQIHAGDDPPRDKLRAAVLNHLEFIFERPGAIAVFIRERRFGEHPLFERYHRRVESYQRMFLEIVSASAELTESWFDAKVAGMATLALMNGIVEWYSPSGRLNRRQLTDVMLHLILDRILQPSPSSSKQ